MFLRDKLLLIFTDEYTRLLINCVENEINLKHGVAIAH